MSFHAHDFAPVPATVPFVTPAVSIEALLDILKRPRFDGTEGEAYLIDTYLRPLPGAEFDTYGNCWVQIGESPVTLFSSHTDTVHKKTATGTYKLEQIDGMLQVKGGGVLGADCGTGVWLMLNMIAAQVPGLYIFHRAEELGRIGSEAIAADPELVGRLAGIQHCVAFDRKATTSVITHQFGGTRCCSDAFAEALAEQLGADGHAFKLDDGGSYTDSASYMAFIPECTNLSVGYYDQHTMQECQDVGFACWLAHRLTQVDWANLPAERDPSVTETLYEDDWDWTNYRSGRSGFSTQYHGTAAKLPKLPPLADHAQLVELCTTYPSEIADILQTYNFSYRDIVEELEVTYDEDLSFLKDIL